MADRAHGFTRPADRHPHAPRDPRRDDRLELVVNLHEERPQAVLVSPVDDGGVAQAWLPRRLITIEPSRSLGPHGVTLRIHAPRWLAEEKQLVAVAAEGQGDLF